MLEFETLALQEAAPHVLIVRLNRPEVANALNTRMGRDLLALWTALTEDSRGLRCVVFTATGGRAFCAGGTWLTPSGISAPHKPSNAPWAWKRSAMGRTSIGISMPYSTCSQSRRNSILPARRLE